jgi:GNAT superfamily N-acetyltransferase
VDRSNALIEWTSAPDHPRVGEAAKLATAYWRTALGPSEPEYPTSEIAWELASARALVDVRLGVAVQDADVVGAVLQRFPVGEVRYSWLAFLAVDERVRRRGVGTALLAAALDAAANADKTRIGWRTVAGDPAATRLSASVGAVIEETLEQHRLRTDQLDRRLLEHWVVTRTERAQRYSLVAWDGRCPDELVDQFAALQAVMDHAPGNDPTLATAATVARLRAGEDWWLARGPYWRVCARDDSTGELVGFTELQLPSWQPWRADQGDTGVRVDHRGRGIGRWLKAVNLLRLLAEAPAVKVVDTTTAATNDPMLSINHAIGFRRSCQWHRWSAH